MLNVEVNINTFCYQEKMGSHICIFTSHSHSHITESDFMVALYSKSLILTQRSFTFRILEMLNSLSVSRSITTLI